MAPKLTPIENKILIATVIVIILLVISLSFLFITLHKASGEIDKVGLKGLWSEIWNGKGGVTK